MALNPLRRRSKLAAAAKTARNAAIADAAWALARDRLAPKLPGVDHRRHGAGRKLLLFGGAAAVVAAGVYVKRDRARALLPGGSSSSESYSPPPPPQPSNYDAPGPVANTATPIPAPDPVVVPAPEPVVVPEPAPQDSLAEALAEAPPAFDESAEEEAAAAEAAAIGGSPSDYAGSEPGFAADEAERPLAESGEGESEGQEQAEADLEENLAPRDAGMTDAERQIEDVIEQAGNPSEGETPEPLVSEGGAGPDDDDPGGQSDWQTWSGGPVKP